MQDIIPTQTHYRAVLLCQMQVRRVEQAAPEVEITPREHVRWHGTDYVFHRFFVELA